MNTASDVPDDEKALTSSDLVGLLKAASLTEFRPDNISDIGEEKFVKSNSLFDLVRSNLADSDEKNDIIDQQELGANETLSLDEIEQKNILEISENKDLMEAEQQASVVTSFLNENDDIIERKTQDSQETGEVVLLNSNKKEFKDSRNENHIEISDDTFVNSDLSSQIEDVSTQRRSGSEGVDFSREMAELKTSFEEKLAEAEEDLSVTLKAVMGASNFIADELETQISNFILSVASDLAGTKIDKMPAPFGKKISRVVKQIADNDNEVKIHLNSKDFTVLNKLIFDGDLQYRIDEKETLKRGEFEVLCNKSSARVSLFDFAKGD